MKRAEEKFCGESFANELRQVEKELGKEEHGTFLAKKIVVV